MPTSQRRRSRVTVAEIHTGTCTCAQIGCRGRKMQNACPKALKASHPKYFCHSYVSRTHGYCGIVNQPNVSAIVVITMILGACPVTLVPCHPAGAIWGGEAGFRYSSFAFRWVAADQVCRLASPGIQLIIEVNGESSHFKRDLGGWADLEEESSKWVR